MQRGDERAGFEVLRIRELAKARDVDALIDALCNQTEIPTLPVRAVAVRHLGEIGDPRAASSLADVLKNDRDERVRTVAAHALGQIGDQVAASALRERLDDPSSNVALAIINSLGRIRDREAVPRLIAYLEDGSWRFRRAAVSALIDIGDDRALSGLENLARSETPLRRLWLRRMLRRLRKNARRSRERGM